ncbi:MAG: SDR family oxidoreductase [Actinomycetota bacterium]|nr:SDR family oxidoreductase [Actinomycetota bacterium]
MGLLDDFKLEGKVAVVTGSGQGIGRGIAWGLAEAGCNVVVNARRQEDLEETAKGVEERGKEALIFAADIRDRSDELVDLTVNTFGKIDVWVNNVGGSNEKKTRKLIDTPDEVFRDQIELNLTTAFQGAKASAKRMGEGGSIINISSGAGMRGSPYTGPYAAAKAAMLNMTETLAIELAPKIRVNAVSPGPVATEMFAEVLGVDGAEDEIASSIPRGFLGAPKDIAGAVVFLSSPAARWVTGRNLLVAGGRTHRSYQYQSKLEED